MDQQTNDQIRDSVRNRYARSAENTSPGSSCCSPSCCSETDPGSPGSLETLSVQLGYTTEDLAAVPEGSNLGLGCGNPQLIAGLKPGDTVLDLGSGAGFDCFLAARQVGSQGRVIGVDMTPEMIQRARENARSGGYNNVEFRLGEIEHLPAADGSVDVIISNCVINLSPSKKQVFREAYRVLRSGGRLAVSDVVAFQEIPAKIRGDLDLYSSCISGAASIESLRAMILESGFAGVEIDIMGESASFIEEWSPGNHPEDYVRSALITARIP